MLVPETIDANIPWWANKKSVWQGNETDIGLTPAQVTQLGVLIGNVTGTRADQIAARAAAKAATLTFNSFYRQLNEFGAGLITSIKGAAAEDPSIWAMAQLDPPKPRTPVGLAPIPTNAVAYPDNSGNVVVTWKGSTAYNTSFQITRQLFGETGWTLIGSVAKKTFTDMTVPAGSKTAAYRIAAIRPAGSSDVSEPAVVVFGTISMAA